MTVKQLADSLGVSKTAVRKRLSDDFRQSYVSIVDGVLEISDDGCKLIAETIANHRKPFVESTENTTENIPETNAHDCKLFAETADNHYDNTVINLLTTQIETKDRQIEALQTQISELTRSLQDVTAALAAAQALHAGTMQERLTSGDDNKKHKGLLSSLFRKKEV